MRRRIPGRAPVLVAAALAVLAGASPAPGLVPSGAPQSPPPEGLLLNTADLPGPYLGGEMQFGSPLDASPPKLVEAVRLASPFAMVRRSWRALSRGQQPSDVASAAFVASSQDGARAVMQVAGEVIDRSIGGGAREAGTVPSLGAEARLFGLSGDPASAAAVAWRHRNVVGFVQVAGPAAAALAVDLARRQQRGLEASLGAADAPVPAEPRPTVLPPFRRLPIDIVAPARAQPVLLDRAGTWTLRRLGFRDRSFAVGERGLRLSFPFRLPAGRRGARGVVTYRLHARLELVPKPGPGERLNVTAGGRSRPVVSVRIAAAVDPRSGTLLVSVDGGRPTASRTISLRRGGLNKLTATGRRHGTFDVSVDQPEAALRLRRVTVYADSAIVVPLGAGLGDRHPAPR